MSVAIKTKEDYIVSNWSGGSTTQLYLYPPASSYARRDFLIRVSSATVELERSTFTCLPGVDRIILPLHGQLHLFYQDHGERLLQPYQQDHFDGGWNTESVGRATDFNVMTRLGVRASVAVLSPAPTRAASLLLKATEHLLLFAPQEGVTLSTPSGAAVALPSWGLAVIEQESGTLEISSPTPTKIIAVRWNPQEATE